MFGYLRQCKTCNFFWINTVAIAKKLIVNGKKSADLQKKEVPTHDWKLLKRELNYIAWAWLYELMQEQRAD